MKLALIETYKKSVPVKDENGNIIVDAMGREKRTRKTMFLYGLKDFTAEEKREYKNFRNRDGEYYREEKKTKTPLYHSGEFFGNEVGLKMWENEDGDIGFSVVTTEVDTLEYMMKEAETNGQTVLAQQLGQQIMMKKLSGKTMNLTPKGDDVEETEEEEDLNN